jgi:hypothetical protein
MNPVAVVEQPVLRELARILDHGVGRPDVETHDLLEPAGEQTVQLSDVTDADGWRCFYEDHIQSN